MSSFFFSEEEFAEIKKWYIFGVPRFGSADFFKAVSKQIVISETRESKLPFIIDISSAVDIAAYHYDFDNNIGVIHMTPALFSIEFYDKLLNFPVERKDFNKLALLALCLINGSLIHEARHLDTLGKISLDVMLSNLKELVYNDIEFLDSIPLDKRNFINKNFFNGSDKAKIHDILFDIWNCVEDIYIENLNSVNDLFIVLKNKALFSNFDIQRRIASLRKPDFYNYIDAMAALKRHDTFNVIIDAIEIEEVKDILNTIADTHSLEERLEKSARIFKILFYNFELTSDLSDKCQNEKNKVDGSGGDSSISSNELKELAEDALQKIGKTDEFKELVGTLKKSLIFEESESSGEIEVVNLTKTKSRSVLLKVDRTFSGLTHYIKARTNRGLRDTSFEKSGQLNENHLYRLNDGNVFSKPEVRGKRSKDIEIIFLIDCSGSTDRNFVAENNTYLWEYAAQRMQQVCQELTSANISNAAICFSSDGNKNPINYIVHDFGIIDKRKLTLDIPQNFGKISSIHKGFNFDSQAITYAASLLNGGSDKTKLIIVLSDGKPNRFGSSKDAVGQTKDAILLARKNGINVFSFSLVKNVKELNDKLYGTSNNFYVGSAKEFKKNVYELFRKIL